MTPLSPPPPDHQPLLDAAISLEIAGDFAAAAVAYHRAIAAAGAGRAGLRLVHWRMARERLKRGDFARALEAMRQALMAQRIEAALDAGEAASMQIDLGDICARLGLRNEAERAFERASAAQAESVLARLAATVFALQMTHEALAVLQRCAQLHPQSADAQWNLAHALAESWRLEEALAALARAEAIAPQPGAKEMRAMIASRSGDSATALALFRELAQAAGPLSAAASGAAMASLYVDDLGACEVADLHRALSTPPELQARTVASFANIRAPERALRLGFLTPDLHGQHPVNIFMRPLLARLDAREFAISVYFTGDAPDAAAGLTRWIACAGWSDAEIAARIEADSIDILIDLAGHTKGNRLGLLARRAAPVQATFLGYPGTTGAPNIDWILADSVVAPQGSENLFSERILRLPQTIFCFSPQDDFPFPDFARKSGPVTFGSFNNAPKLTRRTLKLWAQVLAATPDSRLILKAPGFQDAAAARAMGQRFEAEGVDPTRLELRGPTPLAQMMAEYAEIDIALDPVPYNGGTTTLQALWMGAPVVTFAGEAFVSRMGASFLRAAGLPDWVALSDAEYVAIAARMAGDRAGLLKLKQGLRARLLAAPAWDIGLFARDFGAALRIMWRDHCGIG